MDEALLNDLNERKKRFQSLMVAAPVEFIAWAGQWFHTQCLTFGYPMPWVDNGNGSVPTPTAKPPVNQQPAAPNTPIHWMAAKSVDGMAPNATATGVKWVQPMQAPICKKKAAHPMSYHLPKGAHIQFKSSGNHLSKMQHVEGIIVGFTKLNVKVKPFGHMGGVKKVPYHNIVGVALKSPYAVQKSV